MRIIDHRVEGVPFTLAQWVGEEITPSLVVLHDTASRLEPGSAATYLARNAAQVSAHFVVERDGAVRQLVPTNRRANHAGRSSYHGREGCNGFSLGIEIVNPGKLAHAAGFRGRAWWGELFDGEEHDLSPTPKEFLDSHGDGLWMPYPEAQLDAVVGLLGGLFRGVATLQDITSHWYVSPGRKVDVNPLFPLDRVRALILGGDDPADAAAEAASEPAPVGRSARVDVRGDSLNLRRWPSFERNVVGRIPDGAVVPVLREGVFAGRRWLQVLHAGRTGWIVKGYAQELAIAPERPPVDGPVPR